MTNAELNQLYLTAKLRLLRDMQTSKDVIEQGNRIDALRDTILFDLDEQAKEDSFDSEDIRKLLKACLELQSYTNGIRFVLIEILVGF